MFAFSSVFELFSGRWESHLPWNKLNWIIFIDVNGFDRLSPNPKVNSNILTCNELRTSCTLISAHMQTFKTIIDLYYVSLVAINYVQISDLISVHVPPEVMMCSMGGELWWGIASNNMCAHTFHFSSRKCFIDSPPNWFHVALVETEQRELIKFQPHIDFIENLAND